MKKMITILGLAFLLTACGSGGSSGEGASQSGGSSEKPTVKVVSSGFGQIDQYVQGIAVVESPSKSALGEFVTVSMNFLDSDGKILGTEEQVETFEWDGQKLVLPVFLDLSESNPRGKVASVEASASISNNGTAAGSKTPLDSVTTRDIAKQEYTPGFTASYMLSNKSSKNLEDLRIGVVCYNRAGKIVGGADEYPSLLAAGKSIRLDTDVMTSGRPAKCTAFPNYGDL